MRLADFEAADPEVAATRPTRSQIEYYFTCSPAWILFVLESEPDAEWVTYLDSDLFFFASPDPIYDEMKDAAFGIIPHRFSRGLEDQRRFGNLQCRLGQRRAGATMASRRCAGGASAASNGATTGSRATVSPTSAISTGCPNCSPASMSIEHLGANLAPWNFADCRLEWRDGAVEIERRYPLLFFHFYGVKRSGGYYFNSHRLYHAPFSSLMKR